MSGLLAVVASVVLSAATAPDGSVAEPPASPLDTLPDALPPLDERLLAVPGAPPVRAFAQGRLRLELDDSRDFSRVDDRAVGAAITGRVGVEATAERVRATVVVGDGGRVGQLVRTPVLVPQPVASALYQAELAFDLELLGLPATVAVGRAPLVVSDGRWLGVEPWDARGRSFDGARASVHGDRWEALLAFVWLGPYTLNVGSGGEAASGVAVLSTRARPSDDTLIDLYGFVHREVTSDVPLTIPTIGARGAARFDVIVATLDVNVGADAQAPIAEERSASLFAGTGGHAELQARLSTELSSFTPVAPDPYALLRVEATGGNTVAGRAWHAPAPSQHGALGLFDFFAADNTWSALLAVGGTTPGGLVVEGGVRTVGVLRDVGPLVTPAGDPVLGRRGGSGLALAEGAARLGVPLRAGSTLDVAYSIGIPGAVLSGDAPAQRLLVSLVFAADSDDGSPLPPLH